MTKRAKVILPTLALVVGLAVAVGLVVARPEVERQEVATLAPLVRVMEVESSDLALSVHSQGTVKPRVQSSIVAQVAGRIDWVSPQFAEGGFFKRGLELIRIEDRDFRLAVSQAEAQVAQAVVQVHREQAEADLAKQEWADLGNGTPTSLALREPQLAEAQARVQSAEAALEMARLDLERTQIRAMFDGRVRSTRVDLGQYVARGATLAQVYSTDAVEIRLPVAKDQLAYLDLGDALSLKDSNGDGPKVILRGKIGETAYAWEGRVVRAGSEFDPKTRMLPLFARVEDPLGRAREIAGAPLPVGLFVDAEIEGIKLEQAVTIPREALRAENRVLIVDAENRLQYRDVQIFRLDRDVAVITGGLADGESVSVSTIDTAIAGMVVRPVKQSSELVTAAEREEAM